MASKTAILSIKILTDAKDAAKGLEQAATGVDKWKGRLSTAAKGAGVVLAGLGAAAFAFGKAAADDAQGAAVLANSLQNSTGATKDQVAAVEDWISKTSAATGVADDDLRPALATLARATGSVSKSQKGMSAALDISAATGKDVKSVADALAKGYAGNTTSLGRLVPGLDKATLASGNMHKIMKDLASTTGGAAAAAADTAAGKMARMQVSIQEAKESLGAALLPILAKVSTVLGQVAGWVQKNTGLFTVIAGIVAGLAGTIIVLNAALTAYKVITQVIGVVSKATWLASPIGLVVLAVIALVVVIVILWKKSETFRDIVLGVWAAIKTAFSTALEFIKDHWLILLGILTGPLGLVVVLIIKNWKKIKSVAVAVWNAIKSVVRTVMGAIKGIIRGAVEGIRAMVKTVKTIFSSVFNGAKTVVKTVMGLIRGIIRTEVSGIRTVWGAVKAILTAPFNGARTVVRLVLLGMRTLLKGAVTSITTIWDGLTGIVAAPFVAASQGVEDLIGWIEDLIGWIAKIHIPDLGGLAHTIGGIIPGRSAPAPVVPQRFTGDPALGSMMTRGTATTTSAGGGPTIIVQGALDPEAVARQIRAILAGHDRRVGLAVR